MRRDAREQPMPPKMPAITRALATVAPPADDATALFERAITQVREEVAESPYIREALKVLTVGGYRSAIGSFWNAVVDDLRNKVIHRSLTFFNKSIKLRREVKCYEDFQDVVNDDELIEGAYKIGVIGWEASRVLVHAKETRHIFDGHPRSSEPSLFKVLAMMDDCAKYVLREPYPPQIVDIDEYLQGLSSEKFDRNKWAIESALGDLPEIYRTELANRLFTSYITETSSSTLRSNIGFVLPILWPTLSKETRHQVVRRVDQVIAKGNVDATAHAFDFVTIADAAIYLSTSARKYRLGPIVDKLAESLDQWKIENKCVQDLAPYAAYVPAELLPKYVAALTLTYVGTMGTSYQFSRKDFYANGAAGVIPDMFRAFDEQAAEAFVNCVRSNQTLQKRIQNPTKLDRLRTLGQIVAERVSPRFAGRKLLTALIDPEKVADFVRMVGKSR